MYLECSNEVDTPGFASFNKTPQGFLAGKFRAFIRKKNSFSTGKLHTKLLQQKCQNIEERVIIPSMKSGQNVWGEKVINLRARGLRVIANVFQQFVEAELGEKSSHKINNLCSTCLHESFRKRKFTKLLPRDQANEIKNKVERQVRRMGTVQSCKALRKSIV